MPRIKKQPTIQAGDRIKMACNGTKWSGIEIPLDTLGTVYVDTRPNGSTWRTVQWDGFPRLQGNGYPMSIGGDASKTFLPNWAHKAN